MNSTQGSLPDKKNGGDQDSDGNTASMTNVTKGDLDSLGRLPFAFSGPKRNG